MTPAELQDHLRDTLDYVLRWRELMTPSGAVIDGMPNSAGFGSKMPYADYAADMADAEIAAIGNLAKHTQVKVEIGGRPCIPGFAFRSGRCVGMVSEAELERIANHIGSSDPYYPIQLQLKHMRYHSTLITRVAGVDTYLKECARVRGRSMTQFKQVEDKWLTLKQAAEATGRSERTIRNWGDARAVTVLEDEYGERLYKESTLKLYAEACDEAKRQATAKANAINRQRRQSA